MAALALCCLAAGTAAEPEPPAPVDAAPGDATPVDAAPAADDPPAENPTATDGQSIFEEAPQPFVPAIPRSAAEKDRLEALALFAAGRMREQAGQEHENRGDVRGQNEDYSAALRLYERALRHDPDALPILQQIIFVAVKKLELPDVALRAAIKAVELDPSNAPLLQELGDELKRQGDTAGALRLYEKAVAVQTLDKRSSGYLALRAEMARLYHDAGDHQQAADAAAEVVAAVDHPADYGLDDQGVNDLLGEQAETWDVFGEAFLKAGRHDEALAAFSQAGMASGDMGLLGYRLAQVHSARGDSELALAELQKHFDAKASSEGSAPYALLADVLDKQNRAADLLPRLEKLHELDQDNAPLGYFLAGQLQAGGQLDRAAALYERLIDDSPTPDGYASLAALYRATGQPAELLTVLGKLAAQTGDLSSLGEEAQALAADEATVAAVLQSAREQVQAQDDQVDYGARLAAAMLALQAKRYDDAGEFYRLAIEAKQESAAELMLTWGVGLIAAEQYAQAIEVFERAIEAHVLDDENPVFHYYLSMALEFAGRTDDALATAQAALAVQPGSPRLQSRVAWILFHSKRLDQAAAAYEELIQQYDAVRTNPEVSQVLREARLILSNIRVIQKRYAEAEEWLEQVLDEYPDDISAQNDLGYLWADQNKRLDRALQMAENAVASEPDNTAYLDTLGWCLYRLGRLPEAIAHLEKACATENPDGVILEHLGDVYLAHGQMDQAIAAWQRALARFDPLADAERVAATIDKLRAAGVESAPPDPKQPPSTDKKGE
jgi:tetratricopeptide (TPR) repeat protein